MTTTYTWSIDRIQTLQQPKPNYVVEVSWTLIGKDGQYGVSCSHTQTFDVVELETFIPYTELTEAVVLGWIQSALGEIGIAAAKTQAQKYIDRQINPTIVIPQNTPIPWFQE